MTIAAKDGRGMRDLYLELIRNVHPLRPIRSPREYDQAREALRSLAADRRAEAVDFRKVLGSIIASYEREAGHAVDTSGVSASDIVRHLLTEHGLSVSALARSKGLSQGTLSDMLNGKRQWSKATIVTLCDEFGLSPSVFLK